MPLPWRKLALLGSLFFLFVSLLRAVRAPNLWGATQASWDYSAGFIKRGLFGELLSLAMPVLHYTPFYVLSYAILAAELVLLLGLCWRVARHHPQTGMVLAVAFFSPAMVLHIHTVGYLDHVLLPLLVLVALLPVRRAWWVPVICALGMLVHELFLLLAGPILLVRLVSGQVAWRRPQGMAMLLAGGVMVGLFAMVSFTPTGQLSPEKLGQFTEHLKQKTDFPLRLDNLDVLRAGWQENTAQNIENPVVMKRARAILAVNIPVFAPFLLLLAGWAAWQMFAATRSFWRAGYSFAVPFLPCLSMLVAWDYERILALSVWVGFVQLLVIAPRRALPESVFAPLMGALLLGGLFLTPTLMDGYAVQRFSYMDHWLYLYDVAQGNAPFPRVPGR